MRCITMDSLFDGIGGFPLAAIHNGVIPLKLRFPLTTNGVMVSLLYAFEKRMFIITTIIKTDNMRANLWK